jgi:hypothetical protein
MPVRDVIGSSPEFRALSANFDVVARRDVVAVMISNVFGARNARRADRPCY